jgi:hypothetical protein
MYVLIILVFLIYPFFICMIISMKKNGNRPKRGRPPKQAGELRTEDLLVKLKVDEQEAFKDAAELAGVTLSSWVRERLRRVALVELQEASRPVAVLKN